MEIIEHLQSHHDLVFYLLSGLAFVLELTVMGLSGPLLFFAIGAFITGVLISMGLSSGWESEILICGVITLITAVLMWKPLKRFQNKEASPDTSSDLIGREVPVVGTVTITAGTIRYSGIEWQARLVADASIEQIEAGQLCVIKQIDGTILKVLPVNYA